MPTPPQPNKSQEAAKTASGVEVTRLAKVTDPGSNLYNSYHFLAHLGSLYAEGARLETGTRPQVIWRGLGDLVLEDLGSLVGAWETSLKDAKMGRATAGDVQAGQRLIRACHRLAGLNKAMNLWTPLVRWVRISALVERRWQVTVAACASYVGNTPTMKVKLTPLATSSVARLRMLAKLAELYQESAAHAAFCFKLVEKDDLFGPKFGSGE